MQSNTESHGQVAYQMKCGLCKIKTRLLYYKLQVRTEMAPHY